LVNWVGPDGTALLTVPRYAVEALKPHSTWETIASNNSIAYVLGAFKAGIADPVGMCLQDAGWAGGPWIKPGEDYKPSSDAGDAHDVAHSYHPTIFETWRGYFENHTPGKTSRDWHFSQEDVLTSLVWGGQVLQQVARDVRRAENKLVAAEKLASMAAVYKGVSWPAASFDEGWRTLLLSQHHDCWIVPYNRLRGTNSTWAEWVVQWTGNSNRRADNIAEQSMAALTAESAPVSAGLAPGAAANGSTGSVAPGSTAGVTVFNTTATDRDECVEVALPPGWASAAIIDEHGKSVTTQPAAAGGSPTLLFRAHVPQLGSAVYHLQQATARTSQGAHATQEANGSCRIETDLYSLTLDAARGGVITRLITKGPHAKNYVDGRSPHYLNELRGNFYSEGGFHSSTETPARLTLLENGPLRMRVQIDGQIAGTPFTQLLTFEQGEPRIDIHLELRWTGNHHIGESPDSIKGYPLKKEFYNDSFKLQALFPVALEGQKIYKNAPFDVLRSRLPDTFFDSWDSIKNVVVLNWVDVTDAAGKNGLAVFTDETTSYAHGPHYPLALTVQFSGPGLFGRDYTITGPTTMDYAILPHRGSWDEAGVWAAGTRWNEPLMVRVGPGEGPQHARSRAMEESRSLFRLSNPGWEASAITANGPDLDLRLFNAEGKDTVQRIYPGFPMKAAYVVALDGHVVERLDARKDSNNKNYILITAPRFGIRTIQFKDVVK
jgi:alpha-mannosidase